MNIESNSSRQIKLGAMISYLTIFFNIITGILYTPWMINRIGQSDYALYALSGTFMAYFMIDFGLSGATARLISKYLADKEEYKVYNLLGIIYKLFFLIDILIILLLIIFYFFIGDIFTHLTSYELERFEIIYIITGLFSICAFPFMTLNGIFISYEKFLFVKLCDFLNKVITIFLVIFFLANGYGVYTLVVINTLVGLLTILIKIIYLKFYIKIHINFKYSDKSILKDIFSFSIWNTIITFASRMIMNTAPLILGMVAGSTEISLFTLATTLEAYTWTFANALNGLFLPTVTRISKKSNGNTEITDLMVSVGRVQLFIVGAIITGFICFGKDFIILWMGADFINTYYVALLLMLPGLVTLTQEIAYTFLIAENEIRYRAILFVGSGFIGILLSFLLSPTLGAIGAAIGSFIALLIGHIIGMNIIYYHVLKLDILRFFKECHLSMLLPMCCSVIIGYVLNLLNCNNIFIFILKGFIYMIVYVFLMWKFSLHEYEKKTFLTYFRKMFLKEEREEYV